jgi:hypothetical protein
VPVPDLVIPLAVAVPPLAMMPVTVRLPAPVTVRTRLVALWERATAERALAAVLVTVRVRLALPALVIAPLNVRSEAPPSVVAAVRETGLGKTRALPSPVSVLPASVRVPVPKALS